MPCLAEPRLARRAAAALLCAAAAGAAQAGSWGPTRVLQPAFGTASLPESPLLSMNAPGHALYAWAPTGVLRVADRTPAGGWSAPVSVPGANTVGGAIGVALGPGDVAAVAWVTAATRYEPARLMVAVRAAGAAVFGAATQVPAPAGAGDVRLGVDCDGSVTVVWIDASGVLASTLPGVPGGGTCNGQPGAGPWAAPVALSGAGVGAALPELAVNDAGAALAVWQQGAPGNPTGVAAAYRPAHGAWLAAETVSPPGAAATWNPKPGLDAAGNAAVGYLEGTKMVVARRPAAGAWSAPLTVSGSLAAYYPALAMSANGDVLAAWLSIDAAAVGSVWQSWAPAGAGFPAPARLSSRTDNADWPTAALSADGQTAVVAWTDDNTNSARAAVGSAGRWTRTTLGAGYWAGRVPVGAGAQAAAAGWAAPAAGNPNSATLVGRYWTGP